MEEDLIEEEEIIFGEEKREDDGYYYFKRNPRSNQIIQKTGNIKYNGKDCEITLKSDKIIIKGK